MLTPESDRRGLCRSQILPPENWQILKLLWDYEHGDYYAVLEIDSLEPKYRRAVYKISSNVIAHGRKLIPTHVGFSENKLPAAVAHLAYPIASKLRAPCFRVICLSNRGSVLTVKFLFSSFLDRFWLLCVKDFRVYLGGNDGQNLKSRRNQRFCGLSL